MEANMKINLRSLIPPVTETQHSATYSRIDPSNTTFEAKGKTVFITAGATGIGYEISKAFAQAGVKRIIIVSRRTGPQQKAKAAIEAEFPNTTVEGIPASVTDYAAMTTAIQSAGAIDVLVICHAVGHNFAVPGRDLPLREIQESFDTNAVAPMHLAQQYLRGPAPVAGPKTIIYVSTASVHIEIPGQVGYGPSKLAFSRMLGSYLAAEQGPEKDGVRMFSFHPGGFYTEAAASTGIPPDAMDREDIKLPGHFAVWLASPEADFLHGRFVWAHWDVDEMIKTLPGRFAKEPSLLKFGLNM